MTDRPSIQKTGHGIAFHPDALKRHYRIEDILHVIENFDRRYRMPGRDGHSDFDLYIGRPFSESHEYWEVGVETVKPRGLYIFHAMPARPEFTAGLEADD
ncbi:MAG: hypothetical protein Q4C87_03050 [Actinomycetaceae bacterium]|nr:hypothetical protein [Actinomycetaceae bacterium]